MIVCDFGSKGGAFFSGVKGDFEPPQVTRILGRKICGNFFVCIFVFEKIASQP